MSAPTGLTSAQRLFQISDISLWDCVMSLLLGLVPVTVIEVGKLVRRVSRWRDA